MMTSATIIRVISEKRANNNVLWMRLLELALEHAPRDAKTALREINSNDQAISEMLARLAK